MNKLLPLGVLCAIWSFSFLPCHADPIGPKAGELVMVRGFQLSISAQSQEFAVSTPTIINAFLTNVTDQERLIGLSSNSADYHIEVKTSDGQPVPLTRYGKRRERDKNTYFSRGPLDIAPDKNYPHEFLLNQIFDMTEPGDYAVKVSHNSGFPMENDPKPKESLDVASNVLHITVR